MQTASTSKPTGDTPKHRHQSTIHGSDREGDFYEESGDKLEFKYTKVIFADGADIYYVWVYHRLRNDAVSLVELRKDAIFIPTEEI